MRIINYLHCRKSPNKNLRTYLSAHPIPAFCLLSVLSRKIKLSVRAAPAAMTAPALLLLLASLLAPAAPWCIPAGGVGEYSTKCMESSSVGRREISFVFSVLFPNTCQSSRPASRCVSATTPTTTRPTSTRPSACWTSASACSTPAPTAGNALTVCCVKCMGSADTYKISP